MGSAQSHSETMTVGQAARFSVMSHARGIDQLLIGILSLNTRKVTRSSRQHPR
jgi:hypothetical protein